MTIRHDRKKDPVCGMIVDAHENAMEYLQMHFAFCSLQCKQRFLEKPYLYIGQGGHKSPKQMGQSILKKRRLKLGEPLTHEMAEFVIDAVQAMMGIEDIEIEGEWVTVSYDLLQATEAQIESELVQAGAVLGDKWPERLRRAFVQTTEETECESLTAPLPPGVDYN